MWYFWANSRRTNSSNIQYFLYTKLKLISSALFLPLSLSFSLDLLQKLKSLSISCAYLRKKKSKTEKPSCIYLNKCSAINRTVSRLTQWEKSAILSPFFEYHFQNDGSVFLWKLMIRKLVSQMLPCDGWTKIAMLMMRFITQCQNKRLTEKSRQKYGNIYSDKVFCIYLAANGFEIHTISALPITCIYVLCLHLVWKWFLLYYLYA